MAEQNPCTVCHGEGDVWAYRVLAIADEPVLVVCPACGGTGEAVVNPLAPLLRAIGDALREGPMAHDPGVELLLANIDTQLAQEGG